MPISLPGGGITFRLREFHYCLFGIDGNTLVLQGQVDDPYKDIMAITMDCPEKSLFQLFVEVLNTLGLLPGSGTICKKLTLDGINMNDRLFIPPGSELAGLTMVNK